jgi:hypothetical protein
MSNLFAQIGLIEDDQKRLESINRLQEAFNEVKAGYAEEYNSTLVDVISQIKTKLKNNQKMNEAVTTYVNNYVKFDKREEASEALYNMLSAELVQTFQALTHTSCILS